MLNSKYNPDPPPEFSLFHPQDPIRVAIYARVSSDAQDVNNSIEAQISECKRYAARNNMAVVAVYVDEEETGTSDHRPQFQLMVSDGTGQEKPFHNILVQNPATFPIVQRIFKETIAGCTMADIRRRFNREGVPPPEPKNKNEAKSEKWNHTTFGKIIHNRTYAGFIVWGLKSKDGSPPVITQGRHEAIVSMEEFELAGQVVASNAPTVTHPRRAGSVYMMSRLLRWCPASTRFADLSSISFAGSPPRPGQSRRVAGLRQSGSWGRQTPG